MPEQHALLSASGAHRWLSCTPSARLETQFPDKGSDFAAEGTLAHSLAELKVRKYIGTISAQKYRAEFKKIAENEKYTPEMDTHTDSYLEFIKDKAAEYDTKPFIVPEQRLDFSNIVPEGFGTGDCIMIGGGVLMVIDFKYGQGVKVEAKMNPQMMLYAVGALNAFSILYDIRTVTMHIFQPRIENVDTYTVTRKFLDTWANGIKPIAEKAYNGEGEYNAGEWCRFCRAKSLCRARAAFSEEPFEKSGGAAPELLSREEIGEILKRADAIKKWISDLEEWSLSELLAGNEVPGWKAVEGRSVRQFSDTDAAFKHLVDSGYDEAVLYERKPITLTAVEKLLGKKDFEAQLSEFVIKPPGKPTLAQATDKRAAITNKTTAAEAFGE
ncbi:MAG: DUF2800 domain-containing protein [Ruminiclostridium sp.]|nr:DUF2800 domain-containing protein [Ruminiclostridium sp.]